MVFVGISDTHNLHRHYGREPWEDLPAGDCLLHAGDVTTHGTPEEVSAFLSWLCAQPHRYKVWIAGNHDRCLEQAPPPDLQQRGVYYLQDSAVTLDGIEIYGSPWTPPHQNFAWQLEDPAATWKKIPDSTQILLTHGPPHGILDRGHGELRAGCPVLEERVRQVRPRTHLFGHLHESYGVLERDGTTYRNGAVHSWLWKQIGPYLPHVWEMA